MTDFLSFLDLFDSIIPRTPKMMSSNSWITPKTKNRQINI